MTFWTGLVKIGSKIASKGILSKISYSAIAKIGLGGGLLVGIGSLISSIPSAISDATGGILSEDLSVIVLIGGVAVVVILIARRR